MSNTSIDTRPVLLHLATGFAMGGAERMLARVIPKLTHFRHIFVGLESDGCMRKVFEDLGIEIYGLGYTKPWQFGKLMALRNIIREVKPAAMTTYLIHADVVGRIVGPLFGVKKIIASPRARLDHRYHLHLWLAKLFDRYVDGYMSVSQGVRDFYVDDWKFPAHKFTVITNGIDGSLYGTPITSEQRAAIRRSLGVDPSAPLVGTLSQMRKEKSVDRFVRAMAELRKRHPEVIGVVIGDGPEQDALQTLAKELGVADSVRFPGLRSDVPEVLSALDVFVLASSLEGTSNALLEAMASRKPIVVADAPENREVIGENAGIVVPGENAVAMAQAIEQLLFDQPLSEKLSHAARQRFEAEFTMERQVSAMDRYFSEMLAEK